MLFLSIMSKNKDEKLITLLNSDKQNQIQFTGLSKDYLEKVKQANEGLYGGKRKKETFISPIKHSQIQYDFKTEQKDSNPLNGKFGIAAKTTAKKSKIFGEKQSLYSFKNKTAHKN